DRDPIRPAPPADEAWLLVEGRPAFALAPERRADVTAAYGACATGFAGRGVTGAPSGKQTFRILARAADGTGLGARTSMPRTIAEAPLPLPPPYDERSLDSDSAMLIREDAGTRHAMPARHDMH